MLKVSSVVYNIDRASLVPYSSCGHEVSGSSSVIYAPSSAPKEVYR